MTRDLAIAVTRDVIIHGCRKELTAVEGGAEAKRRRKLKTAGVVGAPCCAA